MENDSRADKLILLAFVLGVHVKRDVDSREILKHSPTEIAEEINRKLARNGRCSVEPKDVVEVLQKLLNLLD